MSWSPFQVKIKVPEELDVPSFYYTLAVHIFDPYKRYIRLLFGAGILSIFELQIPGLTANPITHLPSPEYVWLAVLSAIVTLLMTFILLGTYQYFKDVEVSDKAGGIWTMRVRKNFKVKFHALIGVVERMNDEQEGEIREVIAQVIDKLLTAHPQARAPANPGPRVPALEAVAAAGASTSIPSPGPQQQTVQQPAPQSQTTDTEIQCLQCHRWYNPKFQHDPDLCLIVQQYNDLTRARTLNWYHFPLPWTPQMPSIVYGSPAETPDEIYHNMPDELILKGWFRHMKADDYSVAVLHEFMWTPPGETKVYGTPIVVPAGDNYAFEYAVQQSFFPPVVNQHIVARAEMNMGAKIATEAVQRIRALTAALQISEDTLQQVIEHATDIPGRIFELIDLWREPGKRGDTGTGKWTPKAIAGLAVLGVFSTVVLYLLTHGVKIG
jgi:hypothetical protein